MAQGKYFSTSEIEAIAGALGDTEDGLTGPEIGHLLATCRMEDPSPDITKRKRLYNAFAVRQNKSQNRRAILEFIRQAMKPERYARQIARFEPMRANLNRALLFAGLCVEEDGRLVAVERAETLSDAGRRTKELRADLETRGVHPDVLRFCREELLDENYFHAVFEAVKSIADKLRSLTGLHDDGAPLVDRALGGDVPMLSINPFVTESEKSEQRGFANIVKGCFGMFRNTLAHAPKIHWTITKQDAEDLLTLVSLIHRRLDLIHRPLRP